MTPPHGTKCPPFWQTTFSNEFSLKKMVEFRFKIHWNIFPWVMTNFTDAYMRYQGGDELINWSHYQLIKVISRISPSSWARYGNMFDCCILITIIVSFTRLDCITIRFPVYFTFCVPFVCQWIWNIDMIPKVIERRTAFMNNVTTFWL